MAEYKEEIGKLIEKTNDINLLDLIYQILMKAGGKSE